MLIPWPALKKDKCKNRSSSFWKMTCFVWKKGRVTELLPGIPEAGDAADG